MPERAVPWTQADRDRQSRTLRRLRASTGLEQTPAASALGVSRSTLLGRLGLLDDEEAAMPATPPPAEDEDWDAEAAMIAGGMPAEDARREADHINFRRIREIGAETP